MNSGTAAGPSDRTAGLRLLDALSASPWRALATLVAAHVVFLAVLPFLVSSAPPIDAVEGLIWGHEWLLGTHKLPTLPAWLIEISLHLTGSPILGPYLLSQICVALTYLCVFETGRRLTTTGNALAGTLLLAGVVYFNWTTTEFNHNVIQMPIWAAAILAFTVIRGAPRRPLPWFVLGAVAGIGIYAKYSVVVLYLMLVLWALLDGRMRRALATPWPWLAVLLSLAVAGPHVWWLVRHDFEPLTYAEARAVVKEWLPLTLVKWLAVQAGCLAPMALLLALVGRRALGALPASESRRADVAYVAFMTLAPATAVLVAAALFDLKLQNMWGMPMFAPAGLLAVLLLRKAWDGYAVRRLWLAGVGTIAFVAIAFTINIVVSRAVDDPIRNAWPMAEIAQEAKAAWMAQTSAPLQVVSGERWLAGLVSTGLPERPHVIHDGVLAQSPWLDEAALMRDGVLYVWFGKAPPDYLIPSGTPIAATGSFEVDGLRDRYRTIGYAIRLPAP